MAGFAPSIDGRPRLSVVVPVFNGGPKIVSNVETIRAAVSSIADNVEILVVSDGSIDGTAERLLEARSDVDMRVIHYDRNLGKGYAVKVGALAARGDWIALVDADLDLDPSAVPAFLEVAEREGLDIALGSKRHPDSVVDYPRSRHVMSWGYQQLNRVLFGLDVRDTQVGLKVFSRGVADDVVPLLVVKRFAFDLELLAVANAVGHGRMRELPVRLEYRFSGSGVGWRAVARALVDTAAIFYRLRLLRTYQRKQRLAGPRLHGAAHPRVRLEGDVSAAEALDYPALERGDGQAELVAVIGPGARPAGNWVTAAVPYFARPEVAAVVVPTVAPPDASHRERAAAAVLESRLGGGSRRSAYLPGNVGLTAESAGTTLVARSADWEASQAAGVPVERVVGWLDERGRRTVYTPDSLVVSAPAPLFGPQVRETMRHARMRGAAARRSRGGSVSAATLLSLVPAGGAVAGLVLLAAGVAAGGLLVAAYALVVGASAALAALRFRSVRVGLLAAPGLVSAQAAYVAGFVRGLVGGR
jgi:glycosyltransferase involved in cell wall biosynthesis